MSSKKPLSRIKNIPGTLIYTDEYNIWLGLECEVLAPDELRREIAAEMKAAGALYK